MNVCIISLLVWVAKYSVWFCGLHRSAIDILDIMSNVIFGRMPWNKCHCSPKLDQFPTLLENFPSKQNIFPYRNCSFEKYCHGSSPTLSWLTNSLHWKAYYKKLHYFLVNHMGFFRSFFICEKRKWE